MNRRLVLTALAAACALAIAAPGARAQEPTPAPADSFSRYLEQMSDTTDALFGTSADFDTLGLDSLEESALTRTPERQRRTLSGLFPVVGYHRALGATVGAGYRYGSPGFGVLEMRGSYATSAKLGRYAFAWRRTLWSPEKVGPLRTMERGRIGVRTRLDLDLRYARENLPFMPEHGDPDGGAMGALFWGTDRQSIYESRGGWANLTLWTGDWRLHGGVHFAREEALPVATTFSLFGDEEDVPPNTIADADDYVEPWGGIGFQRSDWELAGTLDGRGGGGDRWRLRGALGKGLRLGPHIKTTMEVEAGAAAANAPRQRRFEIGGGRAVPTLDYGTGGTDHLLVGRIEFLASPDVLNALHLPHPEWLVLQPMAFADAGNVWDDAERRDVAFSKPPPEGWRGSAGGGLMWKIGIPEPEVVARLYVAWPVGPNSGEVRYTASIGRTFALIGRL